MANTNIPLKDYSGEIHLFESFTKNNSVLSYSEKSEIIKSLLDSLHPYVERLKITNPDLLKQDRMLLRAALNIAEPGTLSSESIDLLDKLLQSELLDKEIFDPKEIGGVSKIDCQGTDLILWQGDITCLRTDAIVNAANSQLLGCFIPLHNCIDNAIHSAAGVQLREDCYKIIQLQGNSENTGNAKLTRAYNLPSKYVVHTVGPIVRGNLTEEDEYLLAKCYTSCLNSCKEAEIIKNIAFCCISTGVFGFPQQRAAEIALYTVMDWVKNNKGIFDYIVFNVFSDKDKEIYLNLMEKL